VFAGSFDKLRPFDCAVRDCFAENDTFLLKMDKTGNSKSNRRSFDFALRAALRMTLL
jgi:hypothetical protein